MVNKRNKKIILFVGLAFVTFIGLVFVTFITLLYLWVRDTSPLKDQYIRDQFNNRLLRELPTPLIDPIFEDLTKYRLPEKKEQLRALFHGGREPAMFVQFHTNTEGILYIQDVFTKLNGVKFHEIEPPLRQSGILHYFNIVVSWQEDLGTDLFNKKPINPPIICEYNSGFELKYEVIIDTDNNDVYIFMRYT